MEALNIKNLRKIYWEKKVLNWINLKINEWDFFWFLWHNWAWKTTVIWAITWLVKKDAWEIIVFWKNIDENEREAKKIIWIVPQEFNFNMFCKVEDVPINQAWFYWINSKEAKERTHYFLNKLWLFEKRNSQVKELSWWMKRRLMVVRSLIHNPKLLILDEPTEWIDVEHRKKMWEFIIGLNKAWTSILLTSHYLEEVEELCNKVAIIKDWEIIENTTKRELIKRLDKEIIVLNTSNKITELSNFFMDKYNTKFLNEEEIEISIPKSYSYNELFKDIDKENIIINWIKNKSSKLEQFFLELTKNK